MTTQTSELPGPNFKCTTNNMSLSFHCVSSNWDLEVTLETVQSGSKWTTRQLKENSITIENTENDDKAKLWPDMYTKRTDRANWFLSPPAELKFDVLTQSCFLHHLNVAARSLIDVAQRMVASKNEQFVGEFVHCVLANTFIPFQVRGLCFPLIQKNFTRLVPEAHWALLPSGTTQARPDFAIVVGHTPVLIVECKATGKAPGQDVEAQLTAEALAEFQVYQEGERETVPKEDPIKNLDLYGWIQIGFKAWFYQFTISEAQYQEVRYVFLSSKVKGRKIL